MTESNNNITSSRGGSKNFLAEIANEINEAIINNPQLKSLMVKHTEKVIQKAEEYGQYLRAEWQKAKEAGLTQYDENKDGEEWFWWTDHINDFMSGECVYFTIDEFLDVHFYIEGKPKPDPLSYLHSMIWGSVGEDYDGLELLDYQFVLLAIIHDAQNWQAGRKRIYFNPLEEKTLSNRLCRAVFRHLVSEMYSYNFRDVKNTIKTALQTIKASVEQETKSIGDTYNITDSHVSLGDKARHAGRDIITPKSDKEKGRGKLIITLSAIAVVVAILMLLFGDNIWGRISKKFKSNKPIVEQTLNEAPKTEPNDPSPIKIDSQQGSALIDKAKMTADQIRFTSETDGEITITDSVSETRGTKIDVNEGGQIKLKDGATITQNGGN